MTEPIVTVITTAFNRARTVPSTIQSVRAQTLTDFEHIIAADAGSTDTTVEVVKELASQDDRVRVIHHEHTNQPGGINIGLANARGKYISFLDSDDVMLPQYLEIMTGALAKDPPLGLAYTDAWRMDDVTKRVRRETFMDRYEPQGDSLDSPEQLLTALIDLNFITGESTVKRSAMEDIGGFDESMTHSTDYDVWVRMLASGHPAVRVPGPLLIHRDTSGSLSKNTKALYQCNKKILQKLIDEFEVSDELEELARRQIEQLDGKIAQLSDVSGSHEAAARFRRRIGAIRRHLLDRRIYFNTPPPEIRAAFPDLSVL